MNQSVTVICTSFNRPDLLERTLTSFFKFNTHKHIDAIIVLDDSGTVGCNDHLKAKFPTVQFQYNYERIGQIKSIDKLYAQIQTPYVFHLEEDWEFYKGGFIEDSFEVLDCQPSIHCVWIRSEKDTNGHPFDAWIAQAEGSNVGWSKVKTNHLGSWHGFTFNPCLRRVADYFTHGPYSRLAVFNPKKPWESEMKVGKYFYEKGYHAAIIRGDGYVRHIGDGRGIRA
jgi:GT2 family glycosyltransferase